MRGNKILERLTVKDSNTPHSCDYRYNQVFWDSHLEADLNLDWIDVIEISMDLEEIYDIEIPDDILGDEQHLPYDNQQKTNKFLSLSSSCSGYDSYKITCTVGNLAFFIDEQLSQSKIVSTSL
jgi:acyl carrier protein